MKGSVIDMAIFFVLILIPEGSVYNYTNRCVIAILSLNRQYFNWPDKIGRKKRTL